MDKVKMTLNQNISETENCLKANTSITLKCDWDGNFELIEPNGTSITYKRKEWGECVKHMTSLVRPASGDPK